MAEILSRFVLQVNTPCLMCRRRSNRWRSIFFFSSFPPPPGFFISVAFKGVKAACFNTLLQVLILKMLEGYIILPQELRNCVSKPVARLHV